MQLSELASLLSLATIDDDTKNQTLKPFFRTAGVRNFNGRVCDAFLEFLQLPPFNSEKAVELLMCLQLDLISKRPLQDFDFQNIVDALTNGLESVKTQTFALFLCFTTSMSEKDRIQTILTILNNRPGLDVIDRQVLIDIIPDLVLVSYAASVFMDPTWHLSNGFGTLSFSSTKALLTGLAEVIFEDVSQGIYLSTSELYSFLELCARNLSDLLLQQTLLEHRVLHPTTSNRQQDREAALLLISQSKKLFEKYLKHPADLELVMSSVWKEWWMELTPLDELEGTQKHEIELATTQDLLLSTTNTIARNENPAHFSQNVEQTFAAKQLPMNQNDLYQAFQQLSVDLGKRLGLVTLGRFFLLVALLCGSGALGFFLKNRLGCSIEFSLLCVCAFNIILAAGALYLAGSGCTQSTGDVANNVVKTWQSNVNGVTENNTNKAPGLQPMMKIVVDSLVPQQSACSMTPLRCVPELDTSYKDSKGTINGLTLSGHPTNALPKVHSVAEHSKDTGMTSKLSGLATTMRKLAAHLDKDSAKSDTRLGEKVTTKQTRTQTLHSGKSSLKSSNTMKTDQDILFEAYPHMRESG